MTGNFILEGVNVGRFDPVVSISFILPVDPEFRKVRARIAQGITQAWPPATKRGGKAAKRGISNEQMCILVACDLRGQTIDAVTGKVH